MLVVMAPIRAEGQRFEKVKKEMESLGIPTIQATVMHGEGFRVALAIEGSNRIRAAHELGIPINIQPLLKNNRIAHLILNDIFAYRGWHGYLFNKFNIIENTIREVPHPTGWVYKGDA